jgi:outer membrane protein assembly factor BamB
MGNNLMPALFVRRQTSIVATLLFLASILPYPVLAEDWSQFRGPEGQGHSSAVGLPTHWTETENVRWKTPIAGKGWSSPITLGNRIFLTTAIPTKGSHSLHAVCLDATTGKIVWDVTVFDSLVPNIAKQIHAKNSHASPTPLTDGEHVFVHFGAHGTACLTTDGKIVWKTREIKFQPQHGNGNSPVLVDGLLIFNCDGSDVQFVVALDATTGKVRWKKERPPCDEPKRFSFATPLVIEVNGRQQLVSPAAHVAVAYDPKTGDELWSVRYRGYSIAPRPVYNGGLIYFSTSFDNSVFLAIRPDGKGDVTKSHLVWKQSRSAPYTPSPLLIGNDLFMINDAGIASCLDGNTGRPRWTHRVGGKFSASLLLADKKIYAQSEGGQTIIFRPDPERYVEVARNDLNEQSLATPAVIDHALLIRTAAALYRIENPR